ncbi:MAG: hypothetical protein KHZ58_10955 [Hungatella hathewayi]|nr:hypothetical protein [Hungatella hathewayi]
MCAKIKEFFMRDWSPAEKVMIILCCVSIGVIKGFLLAPIKGGIHCGNDNGDRYFLDSEDYAFDNDDK